MTEDETHHFLTQMGDFYMPDEVFPLIPARKVLPVLWASARKLRKGCNFLAE